jgi:hypothetical protein
LIFLAIVVAVTANFRGGIGFHALGDESIGGKRYLWIWLAVVGYFALVSQPVPPEKRQRYTTFFLLAGATAGISEVSNYLGPAFHLLLIFFPAATSSPGVLDVSQITPPSMERFGGLAGAGVAVAYTLVARYGIEGTLSLRKFWRPVLFFAALVTTTFGGFRSIIIAVGITLVLVFYFEGLLRSRLMPIALLGVLLFGGLTVCFSEHLPLPVQRCLAFLPIKINPIARISADTSTDWRLEIWDSLLPQIPHYLLLGKGLTFDANDMAMYHTLGNQEAMGEVGGGFTLAGDYHNGPLSLIIPFGIWGCIGFLWFLGASIKVLWANYKYGDPDLRRINTLMLCFFISKVLLFLIIFGGFYSDLVQFIGITGFSISLNNGVAEPVPVTRPEPVLNRSRSLLLGRPVISS